MHYTERKVDHVEYEHNYGQNNDNTFVDHLLSLDRNSQIVNNHMKNNDGKNVGDIPKKPKVDEVHV